MKNIIAIIAIICSSATFAQSERPLERESSAALDMLYSGKIDELEKAANDARATNATVADGQSKLVGIYHGVSFCINSCKNTDTEAMWKLRSDRIKEWRAKYPKSKTAKIAEAVYYSGYAWFARGSGYANMVAEGDWKLFRDRIEKSREMLEALKGEDRDDPAWYESMMTIAVTQGWAPQQFEKLYADGIKRFPYSMDLYFSAASYYSAKWGGSDDSFNAFVDAVVNNTRSKMGETMYARLNWAFQSKSMFSTKRTKWDRMKAGFEVIMKSYPDPWNANNYAKFACLAGDYSVVKQMQPIIGEKPIAAAWYRDPSLYGQCLKYANNPLYFSPTQKSS